MRPFLKKGIYTALFIHMVFLFLIFVSSFHRERGRMTIVSIYGGRGTFSSKDVGALQSESVMDKIEGEVRDSETEKAEPHEAGPVEEEKIKKEEVKKEGERTKNSPKKEEKGEGGRKIEKASVAKKMPSQKTVKGSSMKKEMSAKVDNRSSQQVSRSAGSSIRGVDKGRNKGEKVAQKGGGSGVGTGVDGGVEGGGVKIPEAMGAEYARRVWEIVKERWTVPEGIKNPPSPAKIMAKVAPTGEILEAYVKESSGFEIYDACALSAVKASSPLPPPPWKPDGPVEILFIFKSNK